MSWWSNFFTPGDLRRPQPSSSPERTPATPSGPGPGPAASPTATVNPTPARLDFAARRRRQDTIFLGGVAFTCLSLLVTRRALRRKQVLSYPRFFAASDTPLPKPNFGAFDAAEALLLATLTTGSVFMAGIGGAMTYFDIAEVEDLREGVRKGIGYDVYGGEQESDQDLESWMQDVIGKTKDGQLDLKSEVVAKLAELAEKEKSKSPDSNARAQRSLINDKLP